MTASLYATRFGDLLRGLSAADRHPGRMWRLADGDIAIEGDSAAATDIVAVPSEQVLTLAVDLPLPTRKRRIEALPFAVEDDIADPLDAVHLALGTTTAPNRYLAGVVRHAVIQDWIARCDAAGLGQAALVPDALLLPRPAEGSWTIDVRGDRSLVRCADGTGFAIPTTQLISVWTVAGGPACIALGAPLPEPLAASRDDAVLDGEAAMLPLDLRQGSYIARRRSMSGIARRMLVATAVGVAAHACIATADTAALTGIAAQKEQDARIIASSVLPGLSPADDLVSAATARLPIMGGAPPPGRFVLLLGRVSSALASAGPVAVRGMSYDDARGLLTIDLAPDQQARIAQALHSAGLKTISGPGRISIDGRGA